MSAQTLSKYDKLNKKLKLAIKRSKKAEDDVEIRHTTKRGNLGSRIFQSGSHGDVDSAYNLKRKRTYGQDMGEDRTNRVYRDKNDSFRKGSNRFRENEKWIERKSSFKRDTSFNENQLNVGEERTSRNSRDRNESFRKGNNSFRENEKKSEWKNSFKGHTGFKENPSYVDKVDKSRRTMWVPDKKVHGGLDRKQPFRKSREMAGDVESCERKFKAMGEMVDRKEFVEMDSGHSISRRKFAERNLDSGKMSSQGRIKSSGISNVKIWKKPEKKVRDDDSSLNEEQPRKRKRIRLDPHDTSNKRIGDDIVSGEKIKEKKDNLEKDDKISKNAQFRAIEPSPSILSFVEDNFLGRRRLIELRRAGYNIEVPAPLDNNPSSTSERERIEDNVFRNKLTFFAAAKVSSSFPPPELPEIAFAGRSNVGKSSLLNALTRQWGVVRTSDKPGLTQTINFFKLGPKVCMVDLPGYGFAYAKEEVKDAWEELVKEYVSTRVGLRQVCLLIDTKWGMKPRDHELIDLMERFQTKYQIVLTKTDTIFPIDVARRAMQIQENLRANKCMVKPVMMVSSKSGAGIQSLRKVLAKVTRFAKL